MTDPTTGQRLVTSLPNAVASEAHAWESVVHDLLAPLTVLSGHLELLTDSDIDTAQAFSLCAAQGAVGRMRSMITGLLAGAREEGVLSMHDLQDLMDDAIAIATPTAVRYEVSLLAFRDSAPQPVICGGLEIERVMINLLDNAIKYSHPGGVVRAWLRPCLDGGRRYVEVVVADDGIGMTEDEVQDIFTPYYRGDAVHRGTRAGFGLGLASSQAVVAAAGGTLGVSTQAGVGTRFTLRLPAA